MNSNVKIRGHGPYVFTFKIMLGMNIVRGPLFTLKMMMTINLDVKKYGPDRSEVLRKGVSDINRMLVL